MIDFHTVQSHSFGLDSLEQFFGAQFFYFCSFHTLSRILISIIVASHDKFSRYGEFLGGSSMVSNSPPSVSAGRAAMVDLSNGISFCLRHSSTCTAMFFA